MSFKSIDRILRSFQVRPGWEERQRFQELLDCWFAQMEPAVLAQTRPISLIGGVLAVATSNSVWVTELNFQRPRILHQLNGHLSSPLEDIRFSTARWSDLRDPDRPSGSQMLKRLWQEHPSRLLEQPSVPLNRSKLPRDPLDAFHHWANAVQLRSRDLPVCPVCQCPTPPGELKRWSVCAHCAAKQWKT